jgi:hypothetical protein
VQAAATILGPVQEVTGPGAAVADEASAPEQQQQEAEKESNKKDENDDGSTDAALGLINSAPVQVKTDLEQPVTSGGMETNSPGPGLSN